MGVPGGVGREGNVSREMRSHPGGPVTESQHTYLYTDRFICFTPLYFYICRPLYFGIYRPYYYIPIYFYIYITLYLYNSISLYFCIYISLYPQIYIPQYPYIYKPLYPYIYIPLYPCIYIPLYLHISTPPLASTPCARANTIMGFPKGSGQWDRGDQWHGEMQEQPMALTVLLPTQCNAHTLFGRPSVPGCSLGLSPFYLIFCPWQLGRILPVNPKETA